MLRKNRFKNFLSMILTFLMTFSTVDSAILGMKNVYAEDNEKNHTIKIVNDFSKVSIGDEIELQVHDENKQLVSVEKLTFEVDNKNLGKIDEKNSNKFMALGSGTIAIKAILKDKPNISDKVEFEIKKNSKTIPVTKVEKNLTNSSTKSKIKVRLRVEGPEYTILPETEVEVEKGTSNAMALKALGLNVNDSNGMITDINGINGKGYWSTNPWEPDGLKEGSNIVFNGNGAMGRTSIQGQPKAKAREKFEVVLKNENGKAINDADIKYYKVDEYDYKGINTKGIKAKSTGVKTDRLGKASIQLEAGKYFITAEKTGMSRAKAFEVEVKGTIEKKLKVIAPKEITNYEQCNIIVKDEMDKPVNDVEIAYAKDESSLVNNFDGCKKIKTNTEGKAVLNTIELKESKSKYIYYQAKKEKLKSDIQLLNLNIPEYTVTINSQEKQICIGRSYKFNVTVKDSNLNEVTNPKVKWESLDSTVATIDTEGNIKALKEGKATIKVSLENNPKYFAEKEIEVIKGKGTVHLRVEIKERLDFSKDIQMSGLEKSLEDILKGNKGMESYKIYKPKFNEQGKLIELHPRLKGNPVYSVKINGEFIENPRDVKIKEGDNIVCSYNGAINELSLEGVDNKSICGKFFDVIVKDEKGKPVENAEIVVGWKKWEDNDEYLFLTKHGNTDKNGKRSIRIDREGKYYITAQKDGYIRSAGKFTQAKLPDIKLNYPQQVYNDENFDMKLIIDEKNINISELKIYWLKTENKHIPFERNSKLFGTTNDEGKTSGKVEAPIGEYSLVLKFYDNTINIGKIKILDRHKYQSSIIGTIGNESEATTIVNVKDKIYLFGGKSVKCFDTKTNRITDAGSLSEDFTGQSAIVENKIYLFGNEKVYNYSIEDNKMVQIAKLPKGYKVVGRGTAIIRNKIYIYARKDLCGGIIEFNIDTKKSNIIVKKDLNKYYDYMGKKELDGCRIIRVKHKLYIIGGAKCEENIYELNLANKQMKEIGEFHPCFYDNTPININGTLYIINNGRLNKVNLKNETYEPIGYVPNKGITNEASLLINDIMYVFKINYANDKIQGDIIKITGFSLEDKEKPEIIIEGIKDGTVVDKKEIPITVNVEDNVDDNIIPMVKCNDKEVSIKDGKYNLTLNDGSNVIEITAIDKAGNIETKKYTVTYNKNLVPNKIIIEGAKERLHPKDKITLKSKVLNEQNNLIPSQEVIFTSSDEKVAMIDEKTGEVTAIGNGTVILTAQLKDNKSIKESVKITVTDKYKVYVRVEGYDHTILPRTEVEVGLFNLSPYLGKASGSSATESSGWGKEKFDKPSNAHAIVKALIDAGFKQQSGKAKKGDKVFDLQDYGWSLYIAMIGGDREFDHEGVSGWLYRVNDDLLPMGCASISLNDNDEIVWMYSPNGFDNIYTKLFTDETDVAINDKVNINLIGYTGGYQKVEETVGRATILVNGKPYKFNGQEVVTDEKGNATLTFDKPGDYTISATRKDHKGLIDIIRPNPIVIHVTDGKGNKKSKISVNGISNGDTVNVSDIKFEVKAVDKDGKKLNPIVKCNDELLLSIGEDYKATLKEGKNVISIVAEDKDKNIIKKVIEITCITNESTLPEIKVEGIKGGTVDEAKAIFKVEAIDKNDGELQPIVKLNNKEVSPKHDKQYEITLSEGSNIITIEATNKLGNVGREEFIINYVKKDSGHTSGGSSDSVSPDIPGELIKPTITTDLIDGQEIKDGSLIFKVTARDGIKEIIKAEVKLNNNLVVEQYGKYSVKLKEGKNIILISAIDKVGNKVEEKYSIIYKKNVEENLYTKILKSLDKVNNFTKTNGTYSGDWKMVCLKGMGESIPNDYLKDREIVIKDYFENIAKTSSEKITDYERIVIGITAAGGNPTNIAEHNLIERIYNFEGYKKDEGSQPRGLDFQGLNGVLYGLIALDAGEFNVPNNAKYTRQWMLDYILDNRNSDGGWDLNMNGRKSDVDITSMTLIALAPYHDYVSKSGKSVKIAINEAINWLSKVQRKDGGYDSWGSENNSESCAQTIIGLCANGVDPTSNKFTKDINLLEALLKFQQTNGEFYHLLNGGQGVNGMATEQAFQALLAYKKFVGMGSSYCNGKNSIYYFGQSTSDGSEDNTGNEDNNKDKEAPKIEVVGLKDGQEFKKPEILFSVKVTDNVDKDITPVVKVNGEVVNTKDGKYNITLKDGQNTVMIEAVDKSGNKSSNSYNINYKVIEVKSVEKINIKKGEKNKLKIKIRNVTNKVKEITFMAMLFDKETLEMKDFKTIKKQVKAGTNEEFTKDIDVPQEGTYVVKIVFCDDLDPNKMNIVSEPIIEEAI